jgi:hypothetical protein
MIEVNKKPVIKNRSLFNCNIEKRRMIPKANQKYSSVNNLSLITGKNMKNNAPKKCLNVIDFIRQKNKFYMENSFDFRGTREFLASKEVAMRSIKLNDEIVEQKGNNKEHSQQNLLALDFNYYKENYNNNKSSKTAGKFSISPRKARKKNKKLTLNEKASDQKNYKKKSSKKTKDKNGSQKSKNNNKKENSSYLDSNIESSNIIYDKKIDNNDNDNYIYKFFIDNANETEDNFQRKLKKEIKKVENINKRSKEGNNLRRKSLSKRESKYKRPKRMNSVIVQKTRDNQSLFMFSEYNKNLMVNDDLSISSISLKNERVCTSPKKKNKIIKRQFGSIQMNNKQIKEKIKQKINKNNKDEKEIQNEKVISDKDSIISILSDLM